MSAIAPLITPFSAFQLSPEQLREARTLKPEQEAYFQTLMADAASEKIAITPNPSDIMPFIQQEAYLRGQIDILNMLLGGPGEDTARPKGSDAVTQPAANTTKE